MTEIKWSDLKTIIEVMNKSKLTKELEPKKTKTIINDFMKNVESVPQDEEDKIPVKVVEFYNYLVDCIENQGASFNLVEDKEEPKKKEKTKPKAKAKEEKPKKEKTPDDDLNKKVQSRKGKKISEVGTKKGKNEYGATEGSGTYKIDEMLTEGNTIEDIAETVDTPKSRVLNRVASLRKKGVEIALTKVDGKTIYKIAG